MTTKTKTTHPSPAEIEQTLARSKRGRMPLVLGSAVVSIALGVAILWWHSPKDETINWATRAVERGDIIVSANATGTLEPRRTVTIGAEISGRIATVGVENNEPVTVGQVLVTFDTSVLEGSLALARANLASISASERRAVASHQEARTNENRTRTLVERGIVSKAEGESATATTVRAKADLDKARADVERARASVTDVQEQLKRTVITSPIDGVVLSRKVEVGQTVASSLQAPELFVVAEDLSRMKLNVWVDEADVALVQPGQQATFQVSAWPGRNFEATVETLDLAPTLTDNVVTYTAVLSVENPERLLRPGMSAAATIVTGQQTDVLRVPNAALRFQPPSPDERGGATSALVPQMRMRGGGGRGGRGGSQPAARGVATLHVLRAGQPVPVRVQTGRTDGRFTEITTDEIGAGDLVITGISAEPPTAQSKGQHQPRSPVQREERDAPRQERPKTLEGSDDQEDARPARTRPDRVEGGADRKRGGS